VRTKCKECAIIGTFVNYKGFVSTEAKVEEGHSSEFRTPSTAVLELRSRCFELRSAFFS